MEETHAGGCACGAVRYRVRGKPIVATVCHCRFCQRRLASAFAMVVTFPEQAVEVTQGELAACEHRSDESGRWLRMHFCAKCGTTVYHETEFRPGARSIALPTLDDPSRVRMDRHIWVRSKQPWVLVPAGVEVHEANPPRPPRTAS